MTSLVTHTPVSFKLLSLRFFIYSQSPTCLLEFLLSLPPSFPLPSLGPAPSQSHQRSPCYVCPAEFSGDSDSRDLFELPKSLLLYLQSNKMQNWKPRAIFTVELAKKFSSIPSYIWRRWEEPSGLLSHLRTEQIQRTVGRSEKPQPNVGMLCSLILFFFFSFVFWDTRMHDLSLAAWFWEVQSRLLWEKPVLGRARIFLCRLWTPRHGFFRFWTLYRCRILTAEHGSLCWTSFLVTGFNLIMILWYQFWHGASPMLFPDLSAERISPF